MLKNIIANYLGKIWGFVSIYIFVPIYIKLLGVEAYGIINFYSVFLAVLFIADAGLSATLNREMARNNHVQMRGKILKTIEVIYFIISFLIIVTVFFSSKFIGNHWLNSKQYSNDAIEYIIKLMGISISFQLLMNLYCNGLMGREKQVMANNIQIFNSLFRTGIVILLLYQWRDIKLYFYWQIIVNFAFFIYARHQLWHDLGLESKNFKFDITILKILFGFTLGMMGMAIISGLNTQLDKIIISKLLNLETYGAYSLASIFGQICSILTLPIAVSILPRLTKLFENKDESIYKLFHFFSFLITLVSITITLILILYTEKFILIWIADSVLTNQIANTARLLLIGGFFLSLQFMPYHTAIANGHTKTNLRLGTGILIVFPVLTYLSVNQYGMIGASYTWILLNLIAFFILGYTIIVKFLSFNAFRKWLFYDTFIPITISVLLFGGFYFFTRNRLYGYNFILYSILFGILQIIVFAVYFFKFYKTGAFNKIKDK